MDWTEKTIDVITTGEILIDMIGQQMNHPLAETQNFQRFLGGSPANVAFNLQALKHNVRFIGSVGQDGFGEFVWKCFQNKNLSTEGLSQCKDAPTSIILVSKTSGTPDFIPYRCADFRIHDKQLNKVTLQQAKVFHTTCFALSKNPAQQSILNAAKLAKDFGAELSIDLNYSPKIWPDKAEANAVIAEYLQFDPLLKISEDDVERLLGKALSHEVIFNYFQNKFNLNRIYLTLGSQGVKYLDENKNIIHLPAQPIAKVKDATGAGDAFWSGFLYGFTKGLAQDKCLKMGLKLAAIKLQHVGSLPLNIQDYWDL